MKRANEWNRIFTYDESTESCLRWKVDVYHGKGLARKMISAGDVAGCKGTQGYFQVHVGGVTSCVHRIIYEMFSGEALPSKDSQIVIDHIDGNKCNNKLSNLRKVDQKINNRNKKKKSSNTSGKTGITWTSDSPNLYAVAWWNGVDMHRKCKYFSVSKHGLLPAFALACYYREKMIEELNAQGAGYSDKHGL